MNNGIPDTVFSLPLENATEINMSQISIPSLLESYDEFLKK